MNFRLEERRPDWSSQAPIQIRHELSLPASPEGVFAVLADSPGWRKWFNGMDRVRIDGPATGVGALRTVWVGRARVQEHFTVWQPPERMMFHVVASNSPGLRVMVEDYQITPEGNGSKLSITVGVEAKGPMCLVPGLVRFVVGRLAGGALGITSAFP